MGETLKNAADDAAFITALMKLDSFKDQVYIKASAGDDVYTKTQANTAFVKATELKTKAAEKEVVDAIVASNDFTGKVYTKTAADTAFVKTTDLETPTVAEKILGAKDGKKSILVEKLGGFLDSKEAVSYDEKATDPHTAKDFLSAKVGPSVDAVAAKLTGSGNFKTEVIQHALQDPGFENAVRNTMSKPVFEIPENDNAPLSWDW